MAKVKVLVAGFHHFREGRLKISASSSLIVSDQNILVDTGYFTDKDKIISGLAEANLQPQDIDIVVLTHLHLDHLANTYLFDQAKIYCKLRQNYPGQYHLPQQGEIIREELKDGLKLAKDVEIILTPGHTEDHISVVVQTELGQVVIAGDAMPTENLLNLDKKPELCSSLSDFDKSRQKIIARADYIVPGHGQMFKNTSH